MAETYVIGDIEESRPDLVLFRKKFSHFMGLQDVVADFDRKFENVEARSEKERKNKMKILTEKRKSLEKKVEDCAGKLMRFLYFYVTNMTEVAAARAFIAKYMTGFINMKLLVERDNKELVVGLENGAWEYRLV